MHPAPEKLHEAPVLRFIGAFEAPRGQNYPPHQHPDWDLVFYRRGFMEAPIGDEIHRTRPGLLLLTPPATSHAERATTSYANIYALVTRSATHAWPRRAFDDVHGTLHHIFTALLREFRAPQEDSGALTAALMVQLDVWLHRAARHDAPSAAAFVTRFRSWRAVLCRLQRLRRNPVFTRRVTCRVASNSKPDRRRENGAILLRLRLDFPLSSRLHANDLGERVRFLTIYESTLVTDAKRKPCFL